MTYNAALSLLWLCFGDVAPTTNILTPILISILTYRLRAATGSSFFFFYRKCKSPIFSGFDMSNTGVTNDNNGCIPTSCDIPGPLFCYLSFLFLFQVKLSALAKRHLMYCTAKALAHTQKREGHILLSFFFAQESLHQICIDNWWKLVKHVMMFTFASNAGLARGWVMNVQWCFTRTILNRCYKYRVYSAHNTWSFIIYNRPGGIYVYTYIFWTYQSISASGAAVYGGLSVLLFLAVKHVSPDNIMKNSQWYEVVLRARETRLKYHDILDLCFSRLDCGKWWLMWVNLTGLKPFPIVVN